MLAFKNTCSSLKVVEVGGWELLYRIFVSGVEYLVLNRLGPAMLFTTPDPSVSAAISDQGLWSERPDMRPLTRYPVSK